jgi:RNA polymerase sigma-70 factor, ECF subfamily
MAAKLIGRLRQVTTAVSPSGLESQLEDYRRELTGYCYRMLGSAFDAEDAVQETMVRAWRSLDRFEGRAALKSWLYRIATNVCLDMLGGKERRIRPLELGAPGGVESELSTRPANEWLEPIPDNRVVAAEDDPARVTEERETLRLAFVAALQHLPPQQRAVLILREVLRWRANEVAELLETSVPSVNSALQRARATLRRRLPARRLEWAPASEPSAEERALLRRYIEAHERADAAAVAALLREDARLTMPPRPTWYEGRAAVAAFFAEEAFGPGSPGAFRLVPTRANRQPAAANYVRRAGDSAYRALSLDVLRFEGGGLAEITVFAPDLFPAFGLPPTR